MHRKRHGYRPDYFERKRKKDAREVHKKAAFAQKVSLGIAIRRVCFRFCKILLICEPVLTVGVVCLQALGIKGKMYAKKRYSEKATMKKTYVLLP